MADFWINAIGTTAAEWRVDVVKCRQLTLNQASLAYNLAQTRVDITSGAGNTAYFDASAAFIASGFKAAPNSNMTSVTLTLGTAAIQVNGDDANSSLASVARYTADANGPSIMLGKSRGALGGVGLVSTGDLIGKFSFQASRTSVWNESAYARVVATGTVSNTAIPTKWEFGVSPAGSLTPATEATIDERGTAIRQLRVTGLLTPASISTSQNNYAPTGWSTAGIVRINATATLDITGFAAPASDGEVKTLVFIGTGTVTLKDESGSSTAANRLAATADIIVTTDDVIVIQYDVTSTRWRPIAGSKLPGMTGSFGTMAFQNASAVSLTGAMQTTATIGSTGGDTRLLMSGGSGAPTKAFTINYSAALDAQGNMTFQRRTTADGFEVVVGGYLIAANQWFFGAGVISGGFFLSVNGTAGVSGSLSLTSVGAGINGRSGTNARFGVATLVAGTVTVSNTSVTANTQVLITAQNSGVVAGILRVSAKTVGTSFVISSSVLTDTSTVFWMLVEVT